jgi:hypothetical protein
MRLNAPVETSPEALAERRRQGSSRSSRRSNTRLGSDRTSDSRARRTRRGHERRSAVDGRARSEAWCRDRTRVVTSM